ncbi:MAG: 50S ribosomal protein L6 [Patescibacteria group bacterium]|nr:50S ribosomal protein L6 [Patescibacteria group bacterium]
MSRIGKQAIMIPDKVECYQEGESITVKGPLGTVAKTFRDDVNILIAANNVTLTPKRMTAGGRALWGTYASHIRNMIQGVTAGYEKKLIIEGVGFKVAMAGTKLTFNLGWSHSRDLEIPKDLKVNVEKNSITVSGVNKESVGQFAAKIRALKKPEPYQGKGIRYSDEVVRRKAGKKATVAA